MEMEEKRKQREMKRTDEEKNWKEYMAKKYVACFITSYQHHLALLSLILSVNRFYRMMASALVWQPGFNFFELL